MSHLRDCSFGNELNKDLDSVKSARKLPRFSFNQQSQEERSTSSSEEKPRAVDSNKSIMRAYYVRQLLQKALKALEDRVQDVKGKQSLREMAILKHEKVLQLTVINRLKQYLTEHAGHQMENRLASEFFKTRIGRVYLRQWHNCMVVKRAGWHK